LIEEIGGQNLLKCLLFSQKRKLEKGWNEIKTQSKKNIIPFYMPDLLDEMSRLLDVRLNEPTGRFV